jgi:hypothetical protein
MSVFVQHTHAQSNSGGVAAVPRIHATLAQLMKGILYPGANVFLFVQTGNPDDVPPAKDPSMTPNPLASTYGKWEAVENSALAIAEAANLLTIPGRKCSNGLNVPTRDPNWAKLVQRLRDSGIAAYRAARSRNHARVLDAADALNAACTNCHDQYRDKRSGAIRCPEE